MWLPCSGPGVLAHIHTPGPRGQRRLDDEIPFGLRTSRVSAWYAMRERGAPQGETGPSSMTAMAALRPLAAMTLPPGWVAAPHR